MHKIDHEPYPKTEFSMMNSLMTRLFIEQTKERRENGQLLENEKVKWNQFFYKKGEPFSLITTVEFDL